MHYRTTLFAIGAAAGALLAGPAVYALLRSRRGRSRTYELTHAVGYTWPSPPVPIPASPGNAAIPQRRQEAAWSSPSIPSPPLHATGGDDLEALSAYLRSVSPEALTAELTNAMTIW